jgi:hypothetical protein
MNPIETDSLHLDQGAGDAPAAAQDDLKTNGRETDSVVKSVVSVEVEGLLVRAWTSICNCTPVFAFAGLKVQQLVARVFTLVCHRDIID